jgi:NADH pyrophosphatase NudC (nudix superfamily)
MFCLKCGDELKEKLVDGEPRMGCPSCDYVFFDNPVPIAALILLSGDKLLMVRRKIDPPGRYAAIAGYLEKDESAEEAAVREAKEETGLDVIVDRVIGTYSCRTIGMNAVYISCLARIAGGELILGPEIADAKYFSWDELPPYRPGSPLSRALADWRVQEGRQCS